MVAAKAASKAKGKGKAKAKAKGNSVRKATMKEDGTLVLAEKTGSDSSTNGSSDSSDSSSDDSNEVGDETPTRKVSLQLYIRLLGSLCIATWHRSLNSEQ